MPRLTNDLVFHEWWMTETGVAGPDGTFEMRGFRGDYAIEVTGGNCRVRSEFELTGAGALITVNLAGSFVPDLGVAPPLEPPEPRYMYGTGSSDETKGAEGDCPVLL